MTDPVHKECLNCGEALMGPYCHECGQKDTKLNQAIAAFLSLVLDELAGYESRLRTTVRHMVYAPGLITIKHLAGARHSFVPPFRLFLIVSLVFFLLLRLSNFTVTSSTSNNDYDLNSFKPVEVDIAFYFNPESDRSRAYSDKLKYLYFSDRMEEVNSEFVDGFSQALILMLPVLAIYLKLLFFDKPINTPAHLVFALHFLTTLMALFSVFVVGHVVVSFILSGLDSDFATQANSNFWRIMVVGCLVGSLYMSLKRAYQLGILRAVLTSAILVAALFITNFYFWEVIKAYVVMNM